MFKNSISQFKNGISNGFNPIAMGGSMAGSLISGFQPSENIGGQALGGAMQGAAAGAMLGPLGSAGGAIIGGIGGLIKGNQASEAKKAQEEQQRIQMAMNKANQDLYAANQSIANRNIQATQFAGTQNYVPTFFNGKYGGFIPTDVAPKFQNNGLTEYNGQSHEGPNGGIPVDSNGSPVVNSGNSIVGLVEGGENSWKDPDSGEVYVFSDTLKSRNGNTFSEEARKITKKYYKS